MYPKKEKSKNLQKYKEERNVTKERKRMDGGEEEQKRGSKGGKDAKQ